MATAMTKRTTRRLDGWDDRPGEKVAVAFGFIWFLVSLVQLFFVLKRLKAIPSMAARGPYIILSVIILFLALYEVLHGVFLRTADNFRVDSASLIYTGQFFWVMDTAFRPGVVLYVVHQRGDVLRAVKGNTTFPLSTQIWKRIIDWVLVVVTSIMYIGAMGTWAEYITTRDYRRLDHVYEIFMALGETGLAFFILLCINVVVSLTFQIIQGKGTHDPILKRLVTTIIPLFCVFLFEAMFFHIFALISSDYEEWSFDSSKFIIDGAVRIAITTVLILTMTLPGAQWTPKPVATSDAKPGAPQESSASSPINAKFTPQEQPASYWPQPHVFPHEMPLGMSHEGNPYALPAGTEATRPVSQPPVPEVYSTTPPVATQAMTYQPLYPASTRPLPYQSPPPESTRPPNYPSPSPSSIHPLSYQIPSPAKAAPKQFQSAPSPTGELFTHAVFPEEKKEKE